MRILTHPINEKTPQQCTSIEEVRHEIDNIDKVIVELIRQRFDYVSEVVKYKKHDHGSIEAPQRRQQVMEQRRAWAQELGLDPDVIGDIYDRLVQYFIEEEKKLANL